MLKIHYLHILLVLLICPVATVHSGSGGPVIGQATTSIRATAHVKPSLGLTEARLIESGSAVLAFDYESGSHLFWLYAPKPSGVTVSIEPLSQDVESVPDAVKLQLLCEYPYASLVDLSHELTVPGAVYGDVLVTIIYTDN